MEYLGCQDVYEESWDGRVRSLLGYQLRMFNLLSRGRRVNPVEGLYEAFPFFLYTNATYCGWLLEPVLEFANTSQWTFPYAPRDIGQLISIKLALNRR